MGKSSSDSRYVDVLEGLGFCIANDGPLPEAMRKALPTIPTKPTFIRIIDEEVCSAIVMDETGICWIGDGDVSLEAQGFVSFGNARLRALN